MPALADPLLSRLSEHLAAQMGWHFPPDRWRELETGIVTASRELGIADAAEYARDLLAARLTMPQIEVLAAALTIGETYFFRDPGSFEILGEHVLPELIRARRDNERHLRIWSAGCCTGEEAYTLAILLDRLLPDIKDWQITLLATDINSRFLQRAVEGIYSEWSFRNAPGWLKERYFKRVGERRFALIPRIKSLVTFAYLNLGEDSYPSLSNNTNAMDLILCRNVLMYFSPERAAQVIRNFHRALIGNGLFLLSAVETSPLLATLFVPAPFEGSVLYRKKNEFETLPMPMPMPPVIAPFVVEEFVPSITVPAPVVEPAVVVAVRPSSIFTRAVELFDRGAYAAAAAILGTDAADFDSAILLARIHANLGDLATAAAWAERAVAADRTNAQAHYLRAVIMQERDQHPEALAALQKTLFLQPDFVLAHFALGNLEQRQGRRAVAARHFANALYLLAKFDDGEVLPHSDGMAAGSLKEMIRSIMPADAA